MAEALSRPFSVRLPAAHLEQLDELSRLSNRSRNALIARAVERFVTAELEFIHASLRATDEVLDPDAVLVPHDDVRAWLLTWGTPEEDEATVSLERHLLEEEARRIPDNA